MSLTPGTFVPVGGQFAPTDPSTDTYAVIDMEFVRDGFRTVDSTTERNSITTARRKAGMVVGVNEGSNVFSYYKLKDITWDFTDSDWELWTIGGTVNAKEISFGDPYNKATSSSDLQWDYDLNKLTVKSSLTSEEIFEVLKHDGSKIFTIDKDNIIKLYGTVSGFTGFKTADTSSNTIYRLPISDGLTGQFLTTDGNGNLNWTNGSGGGGAGYAETIIGDGTEILFTITHSLGTEDVMVELYDVTTKETIETYVKRVSIDDIDIQIEPVLELGKEVRVLISSVAPVSESATMPGGSTFSVQFNNAGVFSGDEYLKYDFTNRILNISDEFVTPLKSGLVYKFEGGTRPSKLVEIYRDGLDTGPTYRYGLINLYSNYPSEDTLKIKLSADSTGTGQVCVYDTTGVLKSRLSDVSWISNNLLIGSSTLDTSAALVIQTLGNAVKIKNGVDENFSIGSSGDLITKGFIRLTGTVTDVTEGNIRYDSISKNFQGRTNTGWVNFKGNSPGGNNASIQFNNGGVFNGSDNLRYYSTPSSIGNSRVVLATDSYSGQDILLTGAYNTSSIFFGIKIFSRDAVISSGDFRAIQIGNDGTVNTDYQKFSKYRGLNIAQRLKVNDVYGCGYYGVAVHINNETITPLTNISDEYGFYTHIISSPTDNTVYTNTYGNYNRIDYRDNSKTTGYHVLLNNLDTKTSAHEVVGVNIELKANLNGSNTSLKGLYINGTSVLSNLSSDNFIGLDMTGPFKYGIKNVINLGNSLNTFTNGYYSEVFVNETLNNINLGYFRLKATTPKTSSCNIYGLNVDSDGVELNHSDANYHGLYISAAGITDTLSGTLNGITVLNKFKYSIDVNNTNTNGVGLRVITSSLTQPVFKVEGNSYLFELTGNIIENLSVPSTQDKRVKVKIGGVDYYLALYKV